MTNSPDPREHGPTPTPRPTESAVPAEHAGFVEPAASIPAEPTVPVPDEPTTPAPSEPAAHDSSSDDHGPDAVLDDATFPRILEPRGAGRLPLGDGTWHQLARAYVRVQLITQGIFFLLVLAAAIVAQTVTGVFWQWIPVGVVLLVTAISLIITPRQARSVGYQLRRDDLVFRRGILWQRVVAVPYGRMQLVDITHGPLDRGFGIAQLKLVTAAASTGVTIPGLTQEAAEQLRDTLIDVAETRRTGL